jgi:hypothetical protein
MVTRRKGFQGRVMRFLFKLAFWLSIVVILLPTAPSQQDQSSQVTTSEAMSAANSALADMRQFCARQPDACTIGSQALNQFGQKAQAAAKMLYEFLNDRFGKEASRPLASDKAQPANAKPSQNTLSPGDLTAPWRAPQPHKEADSRRPT